MADNLLVTPGSGKTMAADEVSDGTLGTVTVGFGKIMDGTLDSTNKLIVNSSGEAKVTPTANSTVDLNKVGGTAVDANSGTKSAGTLRVVLATDQPALTNKLLVTPDLPSGASTAAKQPALGTAGTASSDVITIQGITSMTKLLVTPDANSAVNVAQVAGTTTDTNSGNKSAGTLRVVLATDQPALTNKLLVTPDANSAVNVAQINGVTPLMGAGNTGTGSARVTIATDQVAIPVSHSKTVLSKGGTVASSGNNTILAADASNKIKVKAYYLGTTSTTEVTCIFQDGASGTELWRVDLQAPASVTVGANLSVPAPDWLFNTSVNTLLNLNLSAAQTIHYSISYFKEAS